MSASAKDRATDTSHAGYVATPIRRAATPADIAMARTLFQEYQAELGVDLCFQGFAAELASLPGAYAPPNGCLLLAGAPGMEVGCVALRPLGVPEREPGAVGEVKRLYVRPSARKTGVGLDLMRALIDAATDIGYRELRLDTLASMTAARAMYERLGFRDIAPYYDNPLAGVRYMALDLAPA